MSLQIISNVQSDEKLLIANFNFIFSIDLNFSFLLESINHSCDIVLIGNGEEMTQPHFFERLLGGADRLFYNIGQEIRSYFL